MNLRSLTSFTCCRQGIATLVAGFFITAIATVLVDDQNEKIKADKFLEAAQERHQEDLELNNRSGRLINAVSASLSANYESFDQLSEDEALYRVLDLSAAYLQNRDLSNEFPGLYSIGLVVNIPTKELAPFIKNIQQIQSGFRYQALPNLNVAESDGHWIVVYSTKASAIGFDSSSDPITLPAIKAAHNLQEPIASAPVKLIEDLDRSHYGHITYFPLDEVSSGYPLLGYVAFQYLHFSDALDNYTSRYHSPKFINNTIYDKSGRCLFSFTAGMGEVSCDESLDDSMVFNQSFSHIDIVYRPTPEFFASVVTIPLWPIVFVGLLLSFLSAFVVRLYNARANNLEELVKQRTVDLQQKTMIAEDALQASHRFVANMSHELRTPLNAVMGINQILLAKSPTPDQSELLKTSQESSHHLLNLINDVLDLSKLESGTMNLSESWISLNNTLDVICTFMRTRSSVKGIASNINISTNLPTRVLVDEKLLKQVLFNIVGNALKFTAKGQISFEVFGEYLDQHTYKFCFLISDTGIGIEDGKIANLFQPFSQADISTTREFGGTGLGLAITKDIINLMGGNIDLQSKLNHGSKVTISLPLKVDAAYHSAVLREKAKDDFSLASRHVVVLDDVITNTEVASMLLQQQGALVKTFNDGQSAIDYCLANPSIDVLFCDIQMPNMDGIQVTQTLRQAGFNNTIVGLSGNAMAIDRAHALANGMDDYMAKPFIIDDAIALLKRHLKTTLVEAV